MDSSPSNRIDRATFDRVLQRAAELQAASKDIGEGLSEAEILALGTEVGIPVSHLQQALLEERTRVVAPEANGFMDRWVGPADLVAQRVVQGTPDAIGPALTRWLERQEHLVVQRASDNRITWEPMEAFARGMRRLRAAFDSSRGKPYLDKAELVTAVIMPLESGFCHVTLAASLRKARNGLAGGGLALPVVGGLMGATLVIIGAPLLVGVVPFVPMALGGWATARMFRGHAIRAQLGLERALDELERRPSLPKPPGMQPGVGHVIRGIAQEVRKALEE